MRDTKTMGRWTMGRWIYGVGFLLLFIATFFQFVWLNWLVIGFSAGALFGMSDWTKGKW